MLVLDCTFCLSVIASPIRTRDGKGLRAPWTGLWCLIVADFVSRLLHPDDKEDRGIDIPAADEDSFLC
jgi:hypothetical protein